MVGFSVTGCFVSEALGARRHRGLYETGVTATMSQSSTSISIERACSRDSSSLRTELSETTRDSKRSSWRSPDRWVRDPPYWTP